MLSVKRFSGTRNRQKEEITAFTTNLRQTLAEISECLVRLGKNYEQIIQIKGLAESSKSTADDSNRNNEDINRCLSELLRKVENLSGTTETVSDKTETLAAPSEEATASVATMNSVLREVKEKNRKWRKKDKIVKMEENWSLQKGIPVGIIIQTSMQRIEGGYDTMKKDYGFKAIAGLAIASVVVIGASVAISSMNRDAGAMAPETEQNGDALDLTGAGEKIEAAKKQKDGTYLVTVREEGFGGAMKLQIQYSADGTKVTDFTVLENSETPSIGSQVTEPAFQNAIAGSSLPIYAEGMDISGILGTTKEDATNPSETVAVYRDGVYEAVSEPASNGYVSHVTVTVTNGTITNVVWDEENNGVWKSAQSENGEYIMVEGHPIWKEQAAAMGAYVVEHQSTDGLNLNDAGKTDAVSGVSVSVGGFVTLVEEALAKATGQTEAPEEEYAGATKVDVISGASVSSKAVIRAINEGYVFLRDHVLNK